MNTLPMEIDERKRELIATAEGFMTLKAANKTEATRVGFAFQTAKGLLKDLEELRLSQTRPLDAKKQAIMDLFKGPQGILKAAIAHLGKELTEWNEAEKNRQAEKQRQIEEETRKAAEAERARLQAESEERKGNWQFLEAARLKQEAEEVTEAVPILPAARPLVHGLRETTCYKFRIIDATKLPREVLIPDEKLLGRLARESKGAAQVPGVEFYAETNIAPTGR